MAEETNLVLPLLRALRGDIADVREEQRAQGQRLGSMERHISLMRSDIAQLHQDAVEGRGEFDSLKARVTRIERRLELHDPSRDPGN